MRRWLIALVAPLLGLAITITILDNTLLRASYIKQRALETGAYDVITREIANDIALNSGQDPKQQELVNRLITPAYVANQIDSLLVQLEAYLRGTGDKPSIDLSGLKLEAAKQGIPVPAETAAALDEPMTLPDNTIPFAGGSPLRHIGTIRLVSAVLAGLLLLVLVSVSRGTARISGLAAVSAGTAISMGLWYGLSRLVPEGMKALLASKSGQASALDEAVAGLVAAIARGVGDLFGLAAAGLLALAVVLGITAAVLKHRLSGEIKPLRQVRPQH